MTQEQEELLVGQFVSAVLAPQTNRNAPPRIQNEQIRQRVDVEFKKLNPHSEKQRVEEAMRQWEESGGLERELRKRGYLSD
jgi:hypothetical protein